jgi:hypothetical protein
MRHLMASIQQHVHRRSENSIHQSPPINGRELQRYDSPAIHVHMMSGKLSGDVILSFFQWIQGRKESGWAGGWMDDATDVRLARSR